MEARTYLKQLFSESMIYGLSRVAVKLVNLLIVPLYTRFFTPEEYGLYGLIANGIFLMTILLILGLDAAASVFFWDKEDEGEQKRTISTWFWTQTVVGAVALPVIIFMSGPMEWLLQQQGGTSFYFILAGFILFFSLPSEIFLNWLRFRRKAKEALLYSVFISLLLIGLNLLFIVKMNLGFRGILYSQLITAAAGALVTFITMRNWLQWKYFSPEQLKMMFRYSAPLIPAAVATWGITSSAVYFINHFLGASEAGIYQVGSTLASGMGVFVLAFQMAWGPFALSIQRKEDAREVYALVLQLYASLSVLLAVFLFFFSKEILMVFTTKEYFSADVVAGILGFNIILGGFIYIASIGLNIAKSSMPYSGATIVASLITWGLFLFLIKPLGKEGAALSALGGQLIVPLYLFYAAQKKYAVPYNFPLAAGIFIIGMLFCAASFFAKEQMTIFVKAALYILLAFVFWVINRKVLRQIRTGK